MAVPRNGAEQGVLSSTRSAPVKNAPAKPCLRPALSILVVALPGSQTSKTPKKLMANAVRITTMNAMNPALWNCIPQPALPPPALTAATMAASIQKLTSIPAVVVAPSMSRRLRLSPACLMRLNSLSESTGNTHGMRFRINPPNRADNSRISVPATPLSVDELLAFSFSGKFSSESFPVSSSFFFKPGCMELFFAKPSGPRPNLTCDGARQMELSQAW